MQIEFERQVAHLFEFMKNSSNLKSAWLKSIEVDANAHLLPVSLFMSADKDLIKKLADWRNEFVNVYPTQFIALEENTKKWVSDNIVPSKSRLLFLIISNQNEILGHVGLSISTDNSCTLEIDNVVKGSDCNIKGLMTKAIQALIKWIRPLVCVDEIELRVMSDNLDAILFYEKLGFSKVRQVPLKKKTENKVTTFVCDETGIDGHLLTMRYMPEVEIGKEMILTAGPSISQLEGVYAFDAAMKGWNENWSKYITRFEQEFAEYVGANYAISTSSCTGALQISLMALGIGSGDEVIVPDETWVASATAVRDVGATPVFCDVDLDTYNMNPHDCEAKITGRTKAILPVHMYGNPADIISIKQIAQKYNLYLVEDAAPSIGAKVTGRCVGTFGDFGCYSFQGAKMLVTGEGGMLVTNSHDLYTKAKKIADQGRNPLKTFWIDEKGVKFKMSNVQAAIGLAQLQRCEAQIAMKQRINRWYKNELEDVQCIEFQREYANSRNINWMTSIRLTADAKIDRDTLIAKLKERNIDTRPLFPAISQYPIWGSDSQSGSNAMLLGKTAMNLPSGVALTMGKIKYVAQSIRELVI